MLLHKWLHLPFSWPENPRGLLSGLTPLDRYLGGLQQGQLHLLCSPEGVGSTSLLLSFCLGVIEEAGILYVSDRSYETVCRRILCEYGGFSIEQCMQGILPTLEYAATTDALGRYLRFPFEIDDKICLDRDGLVASIEAKADAFQEQHGELGLVIIDSPMALQLGAKELESLRALARCRGIAMIVVQKLAPRLLSTDEGDPIFNSMPGVVWYEPSWDPDSHLFTESLEDAADVVMVLQQRLDLKTAEPIPGDRQLQVYRRLNKCWLEISLWLDHDTGDISGDGCCTFGAPVCWSVPDDPLDWDHCDHEQALKDYEDD